MYFVFKCLLILGYLGPRHIAVSLHRERHLMLYFYYGLIYDLSRSNTQFTYNFCRFPAVLARRRRAYRRVLA